MAGSTLFNGGNSSDLRHPLQSTPLNCCELLPPAHPACSLLALLVAHLSSTFERVSNLKCPGWMAFSWSMQLRTCSGLVRGRSWCSL